MRGTMQTLFEWIFGPRRQDKSKEFAVAGLFAAYRDEATRWHRAPELKKGEAAKYASPWMRGE